MKKLIFVHDLGKVRPVAAKQADQGEDRHVSTDPGKELFGHTVKRFDAAVQVAPMTGEKNFSTLTDASGATVDYKNVRIAGYLSVFRNPDQSDRDGDYIKVGAYKDTIERFKTNPVMLIDHRNQTSSIAGSFDVVREDDRGLYVEGVLSQSPEMRHTRFLVAEGHLKTLSIGGIFHFEEDGRGIFKVDLFEGSLVAVPADPEAIVNVRALDEEDLKRAKTFKRAETDRD